MISTLNNKDDSTSKSKEHEFDVKDLLIEGMSNE